MRKIVTVIGTRPQFIKVAPVSRTLRNSFKEVLINTGQHYDYKMSGVFIEELGTPQPDYDLGVGSGLHGEQTGRMLQKIEQILLEEKPDAVLVYGDTNSTLAGALAASKLRIPLIHIEAGLRSFNKSMPEEINRIITDRVSDLLFAPSESALRNLHKEGIIGNAYNVGDVMFDAILFNIKAAEKKYSLNQFGVVEKEYVLATIHRAENTDSIARLRAIISSLSGLDITVLLPLHPRTEKKLKEFGLYQLISESSNVKLIDPVSYLEMIFLEKHARSIITDSGGVQKEAYFLQVPCLTVRDETEWTETVAEGWNVLLNPLEMDLEKEFHNQTQGNKISRPFGDGQAARRITDIIEKFL
ncbi:non-hydrolyzing UDP-N-acetylglucosamine 2-epimerase [Brevibacillus panacihumi]|uniref:non-hydrolyzing UDP-N-acetylglucosamine 2-epimerase n=1 Tax=Brevibacillus panacihumi TaxID=497735 RepID=UPI003D029618